MKIIKALSEMIEDELKGAEHYVKCAIKNKVDNPALAETLYEISTQEMRHVNMLHDEVVKIIKNYREKHGDPPEAMLAVYEWMHNRQIEDAKVVKILQDQYKTS